MSCSETFICTVLIAPLLHLFPHPYLSLMSRISYYSLFLAFLGLPLRPHFPSRGLPSIKLMVCTYDGQVSSRLGNLFKIQPLKHHLALPGIQNNFKYSTYTKKSKGWEMLKGKPVVAYSLWVSRERQWASSLAISVTLLSPPDRDIELSAASPASCLPAFFHEENL